MKTPRTKSEFMCLFGYISCRYRVVAGGFSVLVRQRPVRLASMKVQRSLRSDESFRVLFEAHCRGNIDEVEVLGWSLCPATSLTTIQTTASKCICIWSKYVIETSGIHPGVLGALTMSRHVVALRFFPLIVTFLHVLWCLMTAAAGQSGIPCRTPGAWIGHLR